MNRFTRFISMLMTLMLVVLPLSASAEPTDAYVIRISDPRLEENGEEIYRCNGLAAQLAYCENADASLTQIILDIFSGGDNAGSAMLQFDDMSNIVAFVGGMSDSYTISLDEIEGLLTDMLLSDTGYSLEDIAAFIENPDDWPLVEQIESVLEDGISQLETEELPAQTTEGGISLNYTRYAGDVIPLLNDVIAAIEADPLMGLLLDLVGLGDNAVTGLLHGMNITSEAEIIYGTDETGSVTDLSCVAALYESGEFLGTLNVKYYSDNADPEHTVSYEFYSFTDADGELLISESSLTETDGNSFVNTNESTEYIPYLNSNVSVDELNGYSDDAIAYGHYTIKSTMVYEDGETVDTMTLEYTEESPEYTSPVTMMATGTRTDNGNGYAIDGSAELDLEGTKINIQLAAQTVREGSLWTLEGDIDANLDHIYDMSVGFGVSCDTDIHAYSARLMLDESFASPTIYEISLIPGESAYTGAIYSGDLRFSSTYKGTTRAYVADIDLISTQVDTETFRIDPATAVNLLGMRDDAMEAAAGELEAIFDSIIDDIADTYSDYPGF